MQKPEFLKNLGGRPTKLDEETLNAIIANLELGMPINLAAEAEGINRATFRSWMAEFEEVFNLVSRARATAAKKMNTAALEGGKGSSMNGWMLERRFRQEYGPPRADQNQPSEVKIIIEGGLPQSK